MYTFNKSTCTEPFAGMIHTLAVFAAIANLHSFSFLPAFDAGVIIPAKTFQP